MKKVIISLIIFVLVFSAFQPKKTEAVTGAVAKVAIGTAGERVVIGMAEKAGVKLTTKEARQKAVERWNLELYEKIKEAEEIGKEYEAQELRRLQNMVTTVEPTQLVPAETNGFSKFAIGTAMFLTGADIIYDIYSSVETARNQNKQIELMAELTGSLRTGEYRVSIGGYNLVDDPIYGYMLWNPFSQTNNQITPYDKSKPHIAYLYFSAGTTLYVYYDIYRDGTHIAKSEPLATISSENINSNPVIKTSPAPTQEVLDLPDTIDPLLDPLRSPGIQTLDEAEPVEIPSTYPTEVEITIPDSADYPDVVEVPWNEPLKETGEGTVTEPEPEPAPVENPNPEIQLDPNGNPIPVAPPTVSEPVSPIDGETPPEGQTCGKPWDFKNFKTLGSDLSTAFPFSLPWDVNRALHATFDGMSSDKPQWELSLGNMLGDGKTSITIGIPDFFDKWQGFLHTMLIVAFDIGLVYAIRKLFGGAS